MDEIDTIYEVSMFGQMCYWLDETEYKILTQTVRESNDLPNLIINFTSITGMEVTMPFSSVSDMNISTKAQRIKARQIKKEYEKEWKETEKKEWEE